MPPSAGLPRFDHRADVTGVGLVALALVLGRPLHPAEFPNHLPTLLNEARERTALGEEQPLSQPLRDWLARALQLDTRRAFASAPEALSALEEIVADDSMYVAAPVALETFLSRYIAALLELPTDPIPAPQSAGFAPAPTHLATPYTPSGVSQPAVAPAASTAPVFDSLLSSSAAHPAQASSAAPSFTAPAAYTPSPAPAAISHDTWADATAPAGPGTTARDITELIPASDLKAKHQPSDAAQALFNPDAPFSIASDGLFNVASDDAPFAAAQDAPFTLPAPAAQAAPKSKAKGKRLQLKVSRTTILAAAALVVVAVGGFFVWRYVIGGRGSTPATGTLVGAVESCRSAGVRRRERSRPDTSEVLGAGWSAHSRAPRARRTARHQRERHCRGRGFAVPRVREHARDRQPACRYAARRRKGHRRRH